MELNQKWRDREEVLTAIRGETSEVQFWGRVCGVIMKEDLVTGVDM